MNAEQVADVYARYEAERARRRLLDFDDLIVACADALAGDTDFAESIRWRTRHLFVDEMQDVNPAQFRLLTAMLADEPDLFVVGDPNQSVYGFNGADPTLLDRLPEILRRHQGDPARREPPLHAPGGRGRDRRAPRRWLGVEARCVPPRTTRVDGPVPDGGRRTPPTTTRRLGGPGPRWHAPPAGGGRASPSSPGPTPSWPRCRLPWTRPGCPAGRRCRPRPGVRPSGRAGDERDVDDDAPAATGHSDPGTRDACRPHARSTVPRDCSGTTVIVLGLGVGLMPIGSAQTSAAIEEERRLLYVALTRSEDELWCSWFERARRARRSVRRPRPDGPEPVARPDRADHRRAPEGRRRRRRAPRWRPGSRSCDDDWPKGLGGGRRRNGYGGR